MNKIVSKPLRALAAIAVSGLLLAGCATPPNTAATVNGTRYTETAIADAWEELKPIVAGGASADVVVSTIVQRDLLAPVAEQYDISVSQEEIDELAATAWAQSGAEAPDELSPVAAGVLEFLTLVNKVNASPLGAEIVEQFNLAVTTADVKVNPRFGQFDATTGSIVPAELPWIVQQ